MIKVFISHSSVDKIIAMKIEEELTINGFDVFIDNKSIKIGDNIPLLLYKNLEAADYFIYLLSSKSIISQWVLEEFSIAKMREKKGVGGIKIIPILLDDSPIPISISHTKYYDFRDWQNKNSFQNGIIDILYALGVNLKTSNKNRMISTKEESTRNNFRETSEYLNQKISMRITLLESIGKLVANKLNLSNKDGIVFSVKRNETSTIVHDYFERVKQYKLRNSYSAGSMINSTIIAMIMCLSIKFNHCNGVNIVGISCSQYSDINKIERWREITSLEVIEHIIIQFLMIDYGRIPAEKLRRLSNCFLNSQGDEAWILLVLEQFTAEFCKNYESTM